MKKLMYFAAALLTFAACQKEVEAPVDNATPATYKVTVKAVIDEETKTAYEGEKTFSWVEGDAISMVVIKEETGAPDVIRLTAESAGAVTTFVGDCPEGYTLGDYAFYPKDKGSCDVSKQFTDGAMNVSVAGTIAPDPENPLSAIPLIGKVDDKGYLRFKTATGILKVTVNNIPADAQYLALDVASTALNGTYSFGEDCTLKMENIVGTAWGQKYISFKPAAEGENRDFYFPIPVGKIPAGMTVTLRTASGNLVLAETKEEIEMVRNTIIRTPALTVPAEEWKTIGTGKFKDKFIWGFAGLTDFAEVEFAQNTRWEGKYRLAKPYPGENSDEYFYFDITNPESAVCEPYFVDVEVTADGKETYKPWVGTYYVSQSTANAYSNVFYTQKNGKPANVQLAPCYRGEGFSAGDSANYAYEIGKDHEQQAIEIVFPGCVPYDEIEEEYEVGKVPVTAAMVTASDVCTHDGQGLPGLFDGDPSTIWHSNWYYAATTDPTYGVFFDIALKGKLQNFHFEFLVRAENANAAPTHIVYAVSADGTNWTKLEVEDETGCVKGETAGGTRIVLSNIKADAGYKFIRFGITNSTNTDATDAEGGKDGDLRSDLNWNGYKKCVNMAELELWNDGVEGGDEGGSDIPDYDPITGFEW